MSVLLDILLVALLAFFGFQGFRKGFFKTLLSAGRTLFAVLLSAWLGSYVADWIRHHFLSQPDGGLSGLAADALSVAIGYLLTFLLAFLLLTIAVVLVGRVMSLPVLKQCDRLLGLLLGLLVGVLAVCLLSKVFWALLYAAGYEAVLDGTVFLRFWKELPLFRMVVDKIL